MRTLLFLMLSAGVAFADTKEAAYQAVAVKIATAHTCTSVTGEKAPFDEAVKEAPGRLRAAGFTDAEAQERMQVIVSALGPSATKTITPQLCRDMLKAIK